MLPETFLQPGQSRLFVRDGQRQRSPALHFVCARCKSRVCGQLRGRTRSQLFRRVWRCSFLQPFNCCAAERRLVSLLSPKVWRGLGLC